MWTYLPTWLVQDGQIAELRAGDFLAAIGLRLNGNSVAVATHDATSAPAIIATRTRFEEDGERLTYDVTGTLGVASNVYTMIGASDESGRHVGAEFLLSTSVGAFIATGPSDASLYPAGTSATIRGSFEVMADYEFDAFELPEVRRAWRVRAVKVERRALRPHRFGGQEPGKLVEREELDRMHMWDDDLPQNDLHSIYVVDLEPDDEPQRTSSDA